MEKEDGAFAAANDGAWPEFLGMAWGLSAMPVGVWRLVLASVTSVGDVWLYLWFR